MKLIDTHCHLYLPEFADDLAVVLQRAAAAGVGKMYLPAVDGETTGALLELEKSYPGKCIAMAGLHPCSVKANNRDELNRVELLLQQRKFAAVGETGLDFYWDRNFDKEQYEAFHLQIEWSVQYRVPVVIHSRESMTESIAVIREHSHQQPTGIFHCFSGTVESANEIIELGFYLGIGGVLTYKKSGLAEVLEHISLDHLVLETDAPFLPPVPFRGKRNESSYLVYIAKKLAEIKGVDVEEVAAVTTANAEKIFGS
jgi:TatD DNase family protein